MISLMNMTGRREGRDKRYRGYEHEVRMRQDQRSKVDSRRTMDG